MSILKKLSKIPSLIDRYSAAYRMASRIDKSGGKVRFSFPDGTKYVVDYNGEYMQVEEDLFRSEANVVERKF